MYGVIDVGTTGTKLFIYNREGVLFFSTKVSLGFERREGNYIEQDSGKLWEIISSFMKKLKHENVKYLGLTTYRASVLLWDKYGRPLTNVITWIDRRGLEVKRSFSPLLKFLSKMPLLKSILSIDSPAMLYKWLIWKNPGFRKRIETGEIYFGTLDSYLAYRLTGEYVSDITNATLTGLIHPKSLKPISIVNRLLDIPEYSPRIVDNVESIGEVDGIEFNVMIADQQAAAVAEGCVKNEDVKITNGTGSFVDMALDKFKMPKRGLIPITIIKIGDHVVYGVEGFLPSSGIVLEWMVDKNIVDSYEAICEDEASGEEIFFLPMFRGLRVPYHLSASGAVLGLTLNSSSMDLARGFINGVAFFIHEILDEMIRQFDVRPDVIYCNGGLSQCNRLIQAIADYTGFYVARSRSTDATAYGTLKLLEIGSGKISIGDIGEPEENVELFRPRLSESDRRQIINKWCRALEVGLKWSL